MNGLPSSRGGETLLTLPRGVWRATVAAVESPLILWAFVRAVFGEGPTLQPFVGTSPATAALVAALAGVPIQLLWRPRARSSVTTDQVTSARTSCTCSILGAICASVPQ